ncbi:MAG: stage 0 sporulation family protein [Actinomycetes bacterium]
MVMAVAFVKHGRLYYVDPGEHRPDIGDRVVVDVSGTERVATVLWRPAYGDDGDGLPLSLPAVLRMASERDVQVADDAQARSIRARTVAKRQVREQGLAMQVLAAEHDAADQRTTIWFSAPHRVDFRQLIRTLSRELQMRVLLRQVGDRERAKLLGGVGVCGRELCCATFLDRFEPVTLSMARDQQLGTDPLRISGACGRLMCCLRYEHPLYKDFTGRPPARDGGGDCEHAGSCGSRAAHDAARAEETAARTAQVARAARPGPPIQRGGLPLGAPVPPAVASAEPHDAASRLQA